MPSEPKLTSEELEREQRRREEDGRARRERAEEPAAVEQHERRADKAGYLREKLREQAETDVD